MNNTTKKLQPVEVQLEKVMPYLNLLLKTNVQVCLLRHPDDINDIVFTITSGLLASLLIVDPSQYQNATLPFVRFITHLSDSSAFWEENNKNLIRLLCTLFTRSHYTMMAINSRLSSARLKILFMHAIEAFEVKDHDNELSLENEDLLLVDKAGLCMMNQYGIHLIDMACVQRRTRELLRTYTGAAPSFITGLRDIQTSPRFNPLLRPLEQILHSHEPHEVLIALLMLRDELLNRCEDPNSSLARDLNKLLTDLAIIKSDPFNQTQAQKIRPCEEEEKQSCIEIVQRWFVD